VTKRPDNLRNHADLDWENDGDGVDFKVRRKYLARDTGGQAQIGCSLYEIPPGKKDWPLHFHHANEEAIFVISGVGTLRMPNGKHSIGPGDYAHFQRIPNHAHQIINTGSEPLRFLCMSGQQHPDVTEYPEEGKMGVFCGGAPGTPDLNRTVNQMHRHDAAVGYWD
jgi:uncharacterized cupin superfamily protein